MMDLRSAASRFAAEQRSPAFADDREAVLREAVLPIVMEVLPDVRVVSLECRSTICHLVLDPATKDAAVAMAYLEALLALPWADGKGVALKDDPDRHQLLCEMYFVYQGANLNAADFRTWLRERIPPASSRFRERLDEALARLRP